MLETTFHCSDDRLANRVQGCTVQIEEDRIAWFMPDGRPQATGEAVLVAHWTAAEGVVRFPAKWPTEPAPAMSSQEATAVASGFAESRGLCSHGVIGVPGLSRWKFYALYGVEFEE